MSSNNRNANSIPVPVELTKFQNWSYVEVIKDYHKHLGSAETQAKLALIGDVIKPYRKAKGDELAALRFMTVALYMGDIMTVDCMRALEMVRNHRLNAQVKRPALSEDELKTWQADDVNLDRIKAEEEAAKKSTQTNIQSSSKPEEKTGVDAFVEMVYGSSKKLDELLNDFFGFDIKEAEGMSASEFGEYYTRCKKMGWRQAKKA